MQGHKTNPGAASPASLGVSIASTVAPYRTLNQLMRGLIAALLMASWAIFLACGIYLIRPNTRSLAGILMVLAVPILLVSALPLVYRYWVKNWRTM